MTRRNLSVFWEFEGNCQLAVLVELVEIRVNQFWCVFLFPKDDLQSRVQIIFESRVSHLRILNPFPVDL